MIRSEMGCLVSQASYYLYKTFLFVVSEERVGAGAAVNIVL